MNLPVLASNAVTGTPYRRLAKEAVPNVYFERHPWSAETWLKRWTGSKDNPYGIAHSVEGREVQMWHRLKADPTLVPFHLCQRLITSGGNKQEVRDLILLPADTVLVALSKPPGYARKGKKDSKCRSSTSDVPPVAASKSTSSPPASATPHRRLSLSALTRAVLDKLSGSP